MSVDRNDRYRREDKKSLLMRVPTAAKEGLAVAGFFWTLRVKRNPPKIGWDAPLWTLVACQVSPLDLFGT